MGKIEFRNFLIFLLIGIFLLVGVFSAVPSYRINSGDYEQITAHDDLCTRVTNNRAEDIFVPIKTNLEWDEFRANAPANVVLGLCMIEECKVGGDCITVFPDCRSIMDCQVGRCCCIPPCGLGCPVECLS